MIFFLWSYHFLQSYIIITLLYFSIQHYYSILICYKDWGGDLEIYRSIMWANASAGAETLNLGKRSSDDERRCETMVGSIYKIKDHKSLYDTTSWSCNCVVLFCPAYRAHSAFFSLFSWIYFCFELIELSENLLFVTSFISFFIS